MGRGEQGTERKGGMGVRGGENGSRDSREEGKGIGEGGRRREMSYSLVLKCTNIILLCILLRLECIFKLPLSIKCTFTPFFIKNT